MVCHISIFFLVLTMWLFREAGWWWWWSSNTTACLYWCCILPFQAFWAFLNNLSCWRMQDKNLVDDPGYADSWEDFVLNLLPSLPVYIVLLLHYIQECNHSLITFVRMVAIFEHFMFRRSRLDEFLCWCGTINLLCPHVTIDLANLNREFVENHICFCMFPILIGTLNFV